MGSLLRIQAEMKVSRVSPSDVKDRSKCLACGKATKGQFWCQDCNVRAIHKSRIRVENELAILVRHLNVESVHRLIEHAKDELRETTNRTEPHWYISE